MYRCARKRSHRQRFPSVRLSRATICSMAGSPARKDLASVLTRDRSAIGDNSRVLQRVTLCMSLSAQPRSNAQATDSQLFTFPWGIPREARTSPKARSNHSWSTPPPRVIVAALALGDTLKESDWLKRETASASHSPAETKASLGAAGTRACWAFCRAPSAPILEPRNCVPRMPASQQNLSRSPTASR